MSLRTLEFAVTESAAGIRRNGLMSVTAVATIALSFTILGAFALLALGLNGVTQGLLKQFEIGVFLKTDASEAEVAELSDKIEAMPHVTKVKLITRDAAWAQTQRSIGGQINLSSIRNPMPDQLCVKLDHPRYTAGVTRAINRIPSVDDVVAARQLVERVVRVADLVKWIGMVSAAVLFLVTAFIISNTIRLTLYARRREIRIMQLVGATNWFIRLPFVLEGMVLGTIGAGIAFLLVLVGSRYATQVVTRNMPFLSHRYSESVDPIQFFGGIVILGCVVGALGSVVSIRRFLRL